MRRLVTFGALATVFAFCGGQVAIDMPLITLRIVDPDGRPVPHARVSATAILQGEEVIEQLTEPSWQRVSPRGLCVIDGQPRHRQIADAIVRGKRALRMTVRIYAPGYRPVLLEHEGALPREATVILQPARIVELRIRNWDDRPVKLEYAQPYLIGHAEGSPISIVHTQIASLYDIRDLRGNPTQESRRIATPLFLGYGIEEIGDGVYRVSLPADLEGTIYLIINAPERIRGYYRAISSEELAAGVVEVRLPKPSRVVLTVDFQVPEAREAAQAYIKLTPAEFANDERLQSLWMRYSGMFEATPIVFPRQPHLVITDLAPGAWEASAWLTKGEYETVDRIKARLDAPEGGSVALALRPEPFDLARYRGNRALTLRVQRAGGRPLANAPYRVELNLWRRGKRAIIAQGTLDANGTVRLTNLYETPQGTEPDVNYLVYINDTLRSSFTLQAGDGQQQINLVLPPSIGEPAPDIRVVDLTTGKPLTLQSLRGKWVYLEFWATWCAPCQTVMQALKKATDKHGARWRGRLKIVTVSIDASPEVVMPHLRKHGWDKFARHTWDSEGRAADAYGVRGVPTAFLIDPDGKVVWSGHPLSEDVGTKLNRYLQGGSRR